MEAFRYILEAVRTVATAGELHRYTALRKLQSFVTASADLLFYLAFSGLITHELDAVHKHEWRLLFVLRSMADAPACRAFVLLRVPLFAVLLWLAP